MLIALLVVVTLVIVAMFGLTFYNLSAPRSTLKNILGQKRNKPDASMQKEVSPKVVETLSLAARVNTRTTRTTLALSGFALLGIVVVAMFGLSGQGVRDLRGQVIAAITTLVAAIAGFYFGSRGRGPETASGNGGNRVAPGLGPRSRPQPRSIQDRNQRHLPPGAVRDTSADCDYHQRHYAGEFGVRPDDRVHIWYPCAGYERRLYNHVIRQQRHNSRRDVNCQIDSYTVTTVAHTSPSRSRSDRAELLALSKRFGSGQCC